MIVLDAFLTVWIGTLFVYSGSMKLAAGRDHTTRAIDGYRLVPSAATRMAAPLLPYLEALAGGLILFTPFGRVGLATTGGLSLMFVVATSWALAHRTNASCGCAGRASDRVRPTALIRALALLAASLWLAALADPVRVGWLGLLLAAGAGLPAAASAIRERGARRHRLVVAASLR